MVAKQREAKGETSCQRVPSNTESTQSTNSEREYLEFSSKLMRGTRIDVVVMNWGRMKMMKVARGFDAKSTFRYLANHLSGGKRISHIPQDG